MNVSAKVDYAIRALVTLAAAGGGPLKADELAKAQDIPVNFLENILGDLRRAGIISTQRGQVGGYRLARPASEITLADVIRPIDGPLASIRGVRPDQLEYTEPAQHMQQVWVAVRSALRSVLEVVTLDQVASGKLPRKVAKLLDDADAWQPR